MRTYHPLVAAFAIALSSCTAAQMEAKRMINTANETVTAGKACLQAIRDNKDYELILAKVYLPTDSSFEPPLGMLSDKSLPTKQEVKVLYRLHDDMIVCRKIALDGSSKISPLISSRLAETYAQQDRIWVELVNCKSSYGEFNSTSKDIYTNNAAKLTQAVNQIDNQLQSQHQAEVAQRQQAIDSMQQSLYQQQLLANQRAAINSANRPVTTNCNAFGSSVNCTSY